MDKLKKFDLMEKIGRELEDLKHSQTAVIQKIGKIEVDNIELSNQKLEEKLGVMHQSAADILDSIATVLENFEEVKNILKDVHEEVEWISASRNRREMYSIKGSDGKLQFKIGRNDFPEKILKSVNQQ